MFLNLTTKPQRNRQEKRLVRFSSGMHATAPKERIRTPYTKEPKKRLSPILKTKKNTGKLNPNLARKIKGRATIFYNRQNPSKSLYLDKQ